jgi:LysM repeat protein
MTSATPVLAFPTVEFDEPPRTHPKGHAPADATSFIAQTLKTAGIDVPCSLYNEALRLAREGHLGQAHQRLQMLLCLDPDDADALLLTAKVNAAQGRPADALARLDASVAAGIIAPAGLREALEAAIRAERMRDEEVRAKSASREKSEIGALRNEARHLRSEAIRLEAEATDARERERLWKIATIAACVGASIVILGLVLNIATPHGEVDAPIVATSAALDVARPEEPGTAATVPTPAAPAKADLAETKPAAEAEASVAPKSPALPTPAAAAPKVAAAPTLDAAKAGRIHVVGAGDTLYKLAKSYYGDAEEWERIRDANARELAGSIDLKVGMKLRIP